MPDIFRHPFVRTNNYLGAYNVLTGKNALPIMEDMQFEAVALGPITITANLIDANDFLTASLSTATTLNLSGNFTDQNDTLSASLSISGSVSVVGNLVDANDFLTASLNVPVTATASLTDANDTLSASLNVPVAITANLVDQGDTLSASLNIPASLSGNLTDQSDTLSASLSSAGLVDLTGALTDAPDFLTASLTVSNEPVAQPKDIGDAGDILRRKKPVIMYRPKAVQQLEEAKEELEDIRPSARVSENKKKVKSALAIVKAIEPPPSYAENIAAIETALKNVSRETAKHEGMQAALLNVVLQMQETMAAIEAERVEQKKRNMRKILWLL